MRGGRDVGGGCVGNDGGLVVGGGRVVGGGLVVGEGLAGEGVAWGGGEEQPLELLVHPRDALVQLGS